MKQVKNKTNKQSNSHIYDSLHDNQFIEDIVKEVKQDFKTRQQERKSIENQWQLNMNFLLGNQYCTIAPTGDIEDYEKQYFWQEREVYNHIAPLVEVRMSKLSKVRPSMAVVPASTSESDMKTAKLSKSIIDSVTHKIGVSEKISKATVWSEICGTSFYKINWETELGESVGIDEDGKKIKQGDISLTVCPPYEIFPENLNATSIDECRSIIHAKAYHTETIKNLWGIDVEGENIDVFSLDNVSTVGGLGYTASVPKVVSKTKTDHAVVIEKYEAPTVNYPNGRVIIVAGNNLLHIGELPYINKTDEQRGFPFVRQTSLEQAGSFWGISIIERLIPVQRAYNAVKNRKHEFLNRLSMGILTVEDGSVDTDNLEEEGLSPGKVLVYRQGSNAPSIMNMSKIPVDFSEEETKLLNEFIQISGVSDLMLNSRINSANTSGTALEILLEQDNTRLSSTADQVKFAVKAITQHILRLYKQFATEPRLAKLIGSKGSVEMFYFNSTNITSDDVIFETENEFAETLTQKRNMIFELLKAGLLEDEDGKISNTTRAKTLEMLGFGVWENSNNLNDLHIKKAGKENINLITKKQKLQALEIDNHKLHINEHIAFMLGDEYLKNESKDESIKNILLTHIKEHKTYLKKDD
jgi:hypothetical protein